MNSIRKAFADYTEGLASQKEKIKYWIDIVLDPMSRHGDYSTEVYNLELVKLKYEVRRIRDEPGFDDYYTYTVIPFDYFEAKDYQDWAKDYKYKHELEEKAKKKVKLEEELKK